jgi:hypothetical protein
MKDLQYFTSHKNTTSVNKKVFKNFQEKILQANATLKLYTHIYMLSSIFVHNAPCKIFKTFNKIGWMIT